MLWDCHTVEAILAGWSRGSQHFSWCAARTFRISLLREFRAANAVCLLWLSCCVLEPRTYSLKVEFTLPRPWLSSPLSFSLYALNNNWGPRRRTHTNLCKHDDLSLNPRTPTKLDIVVGHPWSQGSNAAKIKKLHVKQGGRQEGKVPLPSIPDHETDVLHLHQTHMNTLTPVHKVKGKNILLWSMTLWWENQKGLKGQVFLHVWGLSWAAEAFWDSRHWVWRTHSMWLASLLRC